MSEIKNERTYNPDSVISNTKIRRKKTNRACNHCHKAHMTCDTNRPCQRCLQRGLESSCQDAPRKRKKYLADVPPNVLGRPDGQSESPSYEVSKSEPVNFQDSPFPDNPSAEFKQTVSSMNADNQVNQDFGNFGIYPNSHLFQPNSNNQLNQNKSANVAPTQGQHPQKTSIDSHMPQQGIQLYNKPRRTNFLSSAADLEYSTLSNILHDNFTNINHTASTDGTPNSLNLSPSLIPHSVNTDSRNVTSPNSMSNYGQRNKSLNYTSGSSHASSPNETMFNNKNTNISKNGANKNNYYYSSKYPKCDETINQYFLGPTGTNHQSIYPDVITAIEEMRALDPVVYHERNSKLLLSFTIGIVPDTTNEYTKGKKQENKETYKEPDEIYAKVNKPFSYTPGYHSLIAYLRKRFPKEMLVKMAESMASYRPSFIACTNSLKESDLIFMEQCFQRTLLTYDNFIRVSGTPTIVWRRTGEIAYVGNEFCILTGWKKEELLKNKKFIVELLDDKSVLEYFQLFLRIAFGDFLGATMTECTLLTPKNDVKIRTGCMWTLKRDVFGIPMMIIGNFLPII